MTTRIVDIDREAWLGHRWRQHGLDGECDAQRLDDLLLLGMQGSRASGGEQPLSQRTSRIGTTKLANAISPDGPLITMWSLRGAPHAHRASQLEIIRDALTPLETDDGGQSFIDAVTEVAAALQAVVTKPTSKGDASGAMAGAVSATLVEECPSCGSPHVPDDIFRAAGRQAGLVIGPPEKGVTMLHPPPQVEQDHMDQPRLAFLQGYFRVNGPTRWTVFRDWMGVGTRASKALWDTLGYGLVRVSVDSVRHDLLESMLPMVQEAPAAHGVALVPPGDPYLRQVERTLLVPDPSRRSKVYRALSAPGALLVNGEVAGTWRYRHSDRELTVDPFERLTKSQISAVKDRAQALATSTGDEEPSVTVS